MENIVNTVNIVKYEESDYIFYNNSISYEINEISPLLEIYRYKLIKNIKEECRKYFIINKINIDINNILPRWIMLQFKDKNYYIDPLLPYNANDYGQFKKDLYYLSNKKISLKSAEKIIKELNLTNKFNNSIIELRDYIKSDKYNKSNYKINNFDLNNNIYNILITINEETYNYKLHVKIVEKIINNYKKGYILNDDLKKNIICLIIRYCTLDSENQQAAVLPELYKYLDKLYNINGELFASSFNSSNKNYCSIFYDLESNLGSIGNFFTINIKKGFYTINPPFDDTIMRNMSIKLINILINSTEEISFFITIPEWDKDEYGGFDCLNILKQSGFIQYIEKIDKKRVLFYDYYENSYKNLVNVYFILIQNKKGEKKHCLKNNLDKILLNFFPLNN
jgi:hypothetical protein